jgi:hypothetical protein
MVTAVATHSTARWIALRRCVVVIWISSSFPAEVNRTARQSAHLVVRVARHKPIADSELGTDMRPPVILHQLVHLSLAIVYVIRYPYT